MRILFNASRELTHPLAGGSEVLIDRLASGLAERGHDVALCCARPVGDHRYPVVEGGGRLSQFVRSPITYQRRFRDRDLVVDVANGMTFYTPLWRRRATICFVNHIHTLQWSQWFSPPVAAFGRVLERRGMPLVYRRRIFVAVSESTADALVELGVDRSLIRFVHNGVDPVDEPTAKAPTPTFLALGRLVPHKRFDVLLDIWRRVQPVVGGRLVIAGDGPERATLEAMDVPGVELVGRVTEEEKQRLLGEAWLLVHPAELEGWGLVIMEAAAQATPSLGFRVPGVRDAIDDGVSGLIADDAEALGDAWIDITRDDARRKLLAKGALDRAGEFSWERSVDEFEAVAREAMGVVDVAR